MIQDDATRWDLIHKKSYKTSETHSKYAEEKEALFPRNSLVVELGAGRGADAIYFLTKGHSVIALDISPFALKLLQEKVKGLNLGKKLVVRQVDFGLQAIPIKDDSIDVVYSRISLNYFGAKQTTKTFKDIYRILKLGGMAFITMKSPDDSLEMQYLERSSTLYEPNVFIEGGMLRSRFTQEQLKVILKEAEIPGFELDSYQEDLTSKGEEHNKTLFVNEINFKKV
ncbi:MAG: hypothetical protein UT24_C0012G0078 [Candidatus Woesebacteria bacterium GW2011_GWB1_39_12]|uniref:Methyltransferase domain-containing protein n=2 Tax=Candidatus Woeseibacteriota TaxID=1752722 RepID=A0A0G0Q7X0_9BACT|nr:MAG: hypothetical protein UT23_C0008G0039 [Candidatus Woesebacteria bacterium GW2011_GWA1_39_12]KKR00456.1 MAG: hypothetical protein UT24_C0012G0078 [Candidatus Woesebacteria bacterium GW2011_GWB1_39_12]